MVYAKSQTLPKGLPMDKILDDKEKRNRRVTDFFATGLPLDTYCDRYGFLIETFQNWINEFQEDLASDLAQAIKALEEDES